MERTISVNGTGSLHIQPDLTVVSFVLKTLDKDYDKAVLDAARKLEMLQNALADKGFEKKQMKTTSFKVNTHSHSERDENGRSVMVFDGYMSIHYLKLEFDFDTKMLSAVLGAITASIAEPELNIAFTVKDRSAVNIALLKSAAQNARQKAEILTSASGASLGKLISVYSGQTGHNLYSPTRYENEMCECSAVGVNIDIMPDDIDVEDSISFVWEIE